MVSESQDGKKLVYMATSAQVFNSAILASSICLAAGLMVAAIIAGGLPGGAIVGTIVSNVLACDIWIYCTSAWRRKHAVPVLQGDAALAVDHLAFCQLAIFYRAQEEIRHSACTTMVRNSRSHHPLRRLQAYFLHSVQRRPGCCNTSC